MSRWFQDYRQAHIIETLKAQGWIQRADIAERFDISIAQASIDLRRYQAENPGAIAYNKTTKRYEVVPPVRHRR